MGSLAVSGSNVDWKRKVGETLIPTAVALGTGALVNYDNPAAYAISYAARQVFSKSCDSILKLSDKGLSRTINRVFPDYDLKRVTSQAVADLALSIASLTGAVLSFVWAHRFCEDQGYPLSLDWMVAGAAAGGVAHTIAEISMKRNCGKLLNRGFRPEVEAIPDILPPPNSNYVKKCCLEAGLAEDYLQDVYAFQSSEPEYQQTRTRLKSDVTVTRLQVASLSILKHIQARTQEAAAELFSQLDSSSLQALSQRVAQLTDREIADLKQSFVSPETPCPTNLLDLAQDIQEQAKILRDHPQFLEAFFDLPLPRKPAVETSPGLYELHRPSIVDYPE